MANAQGTQGETAAFGRGFLSDAWYFVAMAREVRPGRLQRYELCGEPVVLGRSTDGKLFALRDICPHRAAPLSAGRFGVESDGHPSLECAYHGWRFGADGICRAIPSLTAEQSFDLSKVSVRAYPVAESQGMIFIWVAGEARNKTPPPPRFVGVADGRPKLVERLELAVHVDHAVVGLMDPAHGPFVHQAWWWRSRASRHDKQKAFAPSLEGFTMLAHAPSSNSRAYGLLGGAPQTQISFRLPAYRWEHVHVGKRQVLALTCLTPMSATKTRITQIVWSDHPIFVMAGPLIRLATRRFLRQDGDMVNLQTQGLRYDPPLMWIDDADRQAKWYQALKREWLASRREGRAFVNPVKAAVLKWAS